VPGLAPQKTQIFIFGERDVWEARALVLFERTLFSFERPCEVVEPGMSGVWLRTEIAGEAPPDAIMKDCFN
jgi:hypothetical protein